MQDHEPLSAEPAAPRIEAAAATLAGTRTVNADAFLIDKAAGLFAVADGMRDLPRSREVAVAALDAVRATFQLPWALLPREERAPSEAKERLVLGIMRAHAQLCAASLPGQPRIGTTFAGLVVCRGGALMVAHVGSSRVYLLQHGRRVLTRLTRDDTLLAAPELWGVTSAESVARSDARTLTQAIGATRRVDPTVAVVRWEPEDLAMLCTDGLSAALDPEEMGRMLLGAGTLSETAERLVHRARKAGGRDDTTAVLVRRLS